jgi:hypothetical protein
MTEFISVEKLIDEAKNKGLNFGKGDPYNRLRYYTKIGWLPNMKRKMDNEGNVKGHYPAWALDRLLQIEELKEHGEPNEEISKKLRVKNKFQTVFSVFSEKESRNQIIMYAILSLLLVIVLNEFGILKIGKAKDEFTSSLLLQLPNQILDSGTAFMPKNQKAVFIKTPLVKSNSKIYVSFNNEYAPATRYWTSDIREYEGFVVETDSPLFENSEFSWWITN